MELGEEESVLFREMSLFQGCPHRGAPLYSYNYASFCLSSYRVYCMMGDGETAEGSVWEAASFSSYYKLDNLVAIVDVNRYTPFQFSNSVLILLPCLPPPTPTSPPLPSPLSAGWVRVRQQPWVTIWKCIKHVLVALVGMQSLWTATTLRQ